MARFFLARGFRATTLWKFAGVLFAWIILTSSSFAGTLSDPLVDGYNMRVGTETFAALYKFTTNTVLVETAQAITNLGSDTIKFFLGHNTAMQSGVTLTANITNLLTLARDEPSYHRVLDMPFRHFIMWAYPFANTDAPFQDGNYTATEQANDYREMYDLTRYLLTNYNNSGKTFYLGHWEGDGYLSVSNWTANPSPAVVSNMIIWENQRQKAVDDAKAATSYGGVNVYYYAEANRVRDAMLNGANNNVRMIDSVIPYVTNLDYVSYSSYDAQNLSVANLYSTLDYMQAHLPTNKAGKAPGERMWIGEYGWGYLSPSAQEPLSRAYIQRLLGWNSNGHCLQYILFWEMFNNQAPSTGATNFFLIDPSGNKVPCWYLHNLFLNQARMLTAQFKQTNQRLPSETEFSTLVSPLLDQPLSEPPALTISNSSASLLSPALLSMKAVLTQGIYGDDQAKVYVFWGRQDGGTSKAGWESSQYLGVNSSFLPATFTCQTTNFLSGTKYYFRYYASNATTEAWAPATAQLSTSGLDVSHFACRMKIVPSGYSQGGSLANFPMLVDFSTTLPGFSYRQFASATGNDLRFTDAGGLTEIPYEIDEWNSNGHSYVWVCVPRLGDTNDFIWAYWGNSAATNAPAYTRDGSVWSPNYQVVYHLSQTGFPYADSVGQFPAISGVAPGSTIGMIGHGCSFDGSSQYLHAGTINLGDTFTLSAWVNVAPAASNIQAIWANQKGGYGSAGFAWYINTYNTANHEIDFSTGNGSKGNEATTAANAVSFGQWHLLSVAVNRPAGTADYYVDGANVFSASSLVTDFANDAGVELGRFTNANFYFTGQMDEARIGMGIQSSNWLWASWLNVASNNTFSSYSSLNPRPTLSVTASSAGPQLSWPESAGAFTLYTTTNLSPPVLWSPSSLTPILTNDVWIVPMQQDSVASRFYRLQ